jgi:hypothetical protein
VPDKTIAFFLTPKNVFFCRHGVPIVKITSELEIYFYAVVIFIIDLLVEFFRDVKIIPRNIGIQWLAGVAILKNKRIRIVQDNILHCFFGRFGRASASQT